MKTTKFILICLLSASINFLQAQDQLKKAIKLTESEQYESATKEFDAILQQTPDNADALFFLMENYIKAEKMDSAEVVANKSYSKNQDNPFAIIGIATIAQYKGDTTKANEYFAKVKELLPTRKNKISMTKVMQAAIMTNIAKAYIYSDNKNIAKAISLLNEAKILDPKNPKVYIITGDAFLENADGTNSIANFRRAEELNPKSPLAQLRIGQIYKRAKNYEQTLVYFNNAIKIDSTFAPAFRERGELYSMFGKYEEAKNDYKKYTDLNSNLYAKVRYASFVFLTKEYKDAIKSIKEIQSIDTTYNFLNRLVAYSCYETAEYTDALIYIEKFLTNAKDITKIIPSDYSYYARILAKNNKEAEAIKKYKKAMEMDSITAEQLSKEFVELCNKTKNFEELISMYKNKIEKSTKPSANDYFALGKSYYSAKKPAEADKAFSYITEKYPEMVVGYLWRARANSQMDLELTKGLAKPYYSAVIDKTNPDTQENKNILLEAYNYMGYYFFINKDLVNAKKYYEKMKEIDPSNQNAIKAIDGINKMQKAQKK